MPKIRLKRFLTVLLFVAGGMLVWWLFQGPRHHMPQALAPEAATELETNDDSLLSPPPQPLAPIELPIVSQEAVQRCLKVTAEKPYHSFSDILAQIKPERAELLVKNIHFVTAQGEKRRLQVARDNTPDGKATQRLRYYAVDDEDLPVPLEISDELSRLTLEDRMQALLKDAQPNFTQEKWGQDNPLVEWTTEQGQIVEIYRIGPDGTLGCSALTTCECL